MWDGLGDGIKKLTAKQVETEKRPGKYYDMHGLFLKIYTAGSRNWVQRCTISGKRKDLGLGNANLISLAEARDLAINNLRAINQGIDPSLEKASARKAPTFAEAAHVVYEHHRPNWRNKKHAAQFISSLETYSFPILGSVRVNEVTSADIVRCLKPYRRRRGGFDSAYL